MLYFHYLSLAMGFLCLKKHRKHRSVTCLLVSQVVSLVLLLTVFIHLLMSTKKVAASILTGFAVLLSMCQTSLMVIIFFSGPSHELRRLFCWSFGVIAFANICFTTATIFVELAKSTMPRSWLLVVMGVYVAVTALFESCIYVIFKKNTQIRTASDNQKDKRRVFMYHAIFIVVHISFTATLTLGTLCRNK